MIWIGAAAGDSAKKLIRHALASYSIRVRRGHQHEGGVLAASVNNYGHSVKQ
jgi:hypothetical protein